MPHALISVIVPTYNRAALVTEALDSIAANTYRPIEIVVVDDGSSDDSAAVAEAWAAKRRAPDFAVRILGKANGGQSSARNAGIAVSQGEYVSFLDSDDLIEPAMLQTLADAIGQGGSSFAYCKTAEFVEGGEVQRIIGQALLPWPASILEQNWHVSAFLVKRKVLNDIGFYREELRRDEDWEFDSRLKAFGGKGVFVEEVLAKYRLHAGEQLTKDDRDVPRIREITLHFIFDTLNALSADTRRLRSKCARLMFRNSLGFHAAGDRTGYLRCRNTALQWSGALQRLVIRGASLVGPQPAIFQTAVAMKSAINRLKHR